jgi:orotidine-5'-phosphate decarboxylase
MTDTSSALAERTAPPSPPAAAAAAGARWIVLGRAVTGADDPRAAMQRVHESLGPRED